MSQHERLLSLDFFRGFTIASMILVNNPGSWKAIYSPLKHAEWHGCTPTDLVFPFFIFIMGVSLVYSLEKVKQTPGNSRRGIYLKILKRTFLLIGIGLFLNAFPDFNFQTVRIPGILQRIGLVFLFTAILYLTLSKRWLPYVTAGILLVYWGLMTLVPVPDHGPANLDPATNLGAWLDRLLLEGHLWAASKTWDPEGILSTLPAIGSGLIGAMAGTWMKSDRPDLQKLTWNFTMANLLIVAGLAWDLTFPINKPLWTSSYVLYSSGLALHGFTMCYFLIDVKKWQTGTLPMVVFGRNPIVAFSSSVLVAKLMARIQIGELNMKTWVYENLFASWLNPLNASLLAALVGVWLFYVPIWVMYKRGIIVKV